MHQNDINIADELTKFVCHDCDPNELEDECNKCPIRIAQYRLKKLSNYIEGLIKHENIFVFKDERDRAEALLNKR